MTQHHESPDQESTGPVPASPPGAGIRPSPARIALVAGGLAVALVLALRGVGFASQGTGELRIPAAGSTTVLRVVVFAALAVHLGELAGARYVPPGRMPRSWSLGAAAGGALASAAQIAAPAGAGRLDLATAYSSREGALLLITADAFLVAAGCVWFKRPGLAVAPLAVAVVAEALRAHPESYTPLLGSALTVVHLTAASLWTGGLLYVLRVMHLRRDTPSGARAALARYAPLAVWPVVALAATGTVSSLRRLPLDVIVTTAYGRVLIAKLLLFAFVCALAVTARIRLRRGRTPDTPARAELALLALVVVVSAILTVVPDPHWLSTR
ncbi:CopD family protein [Streptomyces sp. GC420]|uniref:CopD family protein n=1 Tax=Streptomyces sp. GC420 TaxID=2697568 RepID=UPI0014151F17|nr:CopD family protein [Streptomyces sp. GC420]NBM15277.1 copper resistance protein CopD [Streptomyces sp. GC420]